MLPFFYFECVIEILLGTDCKNGKMVEIFKARLWNKLASLGLIIGNPNGDCKWPPVHARIVAFLRETI